MRFYRHILAVLATLTLFTLTSVDRSTVHAATFDCSTATDVPQAKCEALMALYNSTNGHNWTANTNSLYSQQVSALTTFAAPVEKPSTPILVSPTDDETVIGDASPAFVWEANPLDEEVITYRLIVRDANKTILLNQEFVAYVVCGGVLCTADIGELDTPVNLKNGQYSFRVRAFNAAGSTDSPYHAFSILFPARPVLVSPIGDITIDNIQPPLTWEEVEGATQYRVTLWNPSKLKVDGTIWADRATVHCNGTTCSYTPYKLKNRTYTWIVEARNTAISPSKSTSIKGTFTVAFPGAPTLVSPIDNVVVNDNLPTFIWTEVEAADEYSLKIYDAANKRAGGAGWYSSAVFNCDGTHCSYKATSITSILKDGTYTWKVEARNKALFHESIMKSAKSAFKVVFPGVPTDLMPAPDTTLDIASPTFTWAPVKSANKYSLIITRNAKPTPPALDQVFNAIDICTLDTCTVDLSALETPVTLKNGAHKWQVKATAKYGYTSATTKQPFTILLP